MYRVSRDFPPSLRSSLSLSLYRVSRLLLLIIILGGKIGCLGRAGGDWRGWLTMYTWDIIHGIFCGSVTHADLGSCVVQQLLLQHAAVFHCQGLEFNSASFQFVKVLKACERQSCL